MTLCQIVNPHCKESGFPSKGTALFSRTQSLEFPESAAWNPFPIGRRPLLVSPGIAALLYQPLQMSAQKEERGLRSGCSEWSQWIPRHAGYVCGLTA